MKRVAFDKRIEDYLNNEIIRLNKLGLTNVTKPDALRFIIEQNKAVKLKVKRKPRKKFAFIFG